MSVKIKARCRSFSIQVKQTQVTRECHHASRQSTVVAPAASHPSHRRHRHGGMGGRTDLRHAICSQRGMSVGREEYNASVRAGSNQRRATIRWGGRFVIAAFGVELIQREAVGMVVHVLVGIMFARAGGRHRARDTRTVISGGEGAISLRFVGIIFVMLLRSPVLI